MQQSHSNKRSGRAPARKINVPDKINNYMVRYLSEKFPLEFCAEPILVYFMKEIEDEEQNRNSWDLGDTIDANKNLLEELAKLL